MEEKKLYCMNCSKREKTGFCKEEQDYVPKKQTALGVNRAKTCDYFANKK